MNLASTRRNWPTGRGFERFYGFLGAETSQWYPDLVYDNHPVDQPQVAGGGLPLHRGHHRQGDRVHQRRQGDRPGEAVLPLLRAGRVSRAASRAEGVDRPLPRSVRHGLRGDARADAGPPEGARHRARRHRAAAGQPASARTKRAPGPTASRSRRWTRRCAGTRSPTTRSGCSRGWPRSTRVPVARRPSHRPAPRLPRSDRAAREHARHRRVRQRCERRGRSQRLGERDEVRERHPRRHGVEPRAHRRAGRPEDLQPLSQRLGDGVQHAVQDVEALRVQRRDVRPVHRVVAGRDQGTRRGPRPVPPRDRPGAHGARRARRRSAARRSRATCRAASTA